jgi:hypothetical protein
MDSHPLPKTDKFFKALAEHLLRFTPARRQEMLRAGEAVVEAARRAVRPSARPTPPRPSPKQ